MTAELVGVAFNMSTLLLVSQVFIESLDVHVLLLLTLMVGGDIYAAAVLFQDVVEHLLVGSVQSL